MSKTFDINGKKANLGKVLPLKIKDWRILKAEHGIDPTDLSKIAEDFDLLTKMCSYVIQKANPAITPEDIDELTLDELLLMFTSSVESSDTDRPT